MPGCEAPKCPPCLDSFFSKQTNGTAVCCAPRLQQQPLFTDPWCFLSFMPGTCSPPCSPCSCNARLSCLQRNPLRCGFVMHEYPFVVPSFRGSLCACSHLLPSALLSSLQRPLTWLLCSEHHPVITYASHIHLTHHVLRVSPRHSPPVRYRRRTIPKHMPASPSLCTSSRALH